MLKYLPLLILLVPTAEARDRAEMFSVGAGGGFSMASPVASETFRNSVSMAMPKLTFFGRYHHFSSYTGFELSMDYFQLGDTTLASKSLTMSLFWRGLPLSNVHPVFSIGFGLAKVDSFFRAGDSDQPFHRLRVGAEWELTKNVDVGFHLDHFTMFKSNVQDENLHVLAPTISLMHYFGNPPPAVTAPAPKAAAASPAPPARQTFEHPLNITFRGSTAVITKADNKALSSLARVMAENGQMKAEIQGHTDNVGGESKNKKLSLARAQAVRQLLIRKYKVDGSRLMAVGYGSSQPVDTNNNASGRKNNTRIIAKLSR